MSSAYAEHYELGAGAGVPEVREARFGVGAGAGVPEVREARFGVGAAEHYDMIAASANVAEGNS